MTMPFALPPWVPWWVPIVVLIPLLLYALVLFVMPFSVIGVKGRLDALDGRLDEIQDDLRRLMTRLPEPMAGPVFEDTGYTPPVFPADESRTRSQVRPMRTEPRLERPR